MIDLRLWRLALLLVVPALLVAMFSLRDVPRPLEPTLPPDAFEGSAAATLARDLHALAPEPRPGSDDDAALAEAILERFKQIPSVEVSEQRFEGEAGGEDVELRNLIARLPGQSERQVALLAGRDVLAGSGAASTVASSAAMLEIAAGFAGSTHSKTLVFVSTDGASVGALGARRFASDYTDAGLLDAVVVLSQPAAGRPAQPLVVPWSAGTDSTGAKLSGSADAIVAGEVDEPAGDQGPAAEVFRLAIPSSLGEQGPLIDAGLDAVRLSSSGELPPPAAADEEAEVDVDTLDRFGRAALSLILAVDSAREPLEHGPATYIGLAGNLLPGWTLGLLALSLLAAAAVTSFAGVAVAARSPAQALRALAWTALRAVPLLLALAVVAAAALVGLVPSPEFPFLPGYEQIGAGG
ncbi:MAG: M28 family peptidase, partial [Actinobacteria bacterium]|nr:M28 family peptidase [Actinomycetota bacterium]